MAHVKLDPKETGKMFNYKRVIAAAEIEYDRWVENDSKANPVQPMIVNMEFAQLSKHEQDMIRRDRFIRAMNVNGSEFKAVDKGTTIHDLMVWDCWPVDIIDADNADRAELLTAKIDSHYGTEYLRRMECFRPALKETVENIGFDFGDKGEGVRQIYIVLNNILGVMVWG